MLRSVVEAVGVSLQLGWRGALRLALRFRIVALGLNLVAIAGGCAYITTGFLLCRVLFGGVF